MEKRPPIRAELKRKIFVEAGHRCAIPTCRYIEVDIHHIIPWAKCKKHEYKNLIALCSNCHKRADSGKIDRRSLRMYKNNLRYIYDKFTTFEIDLLYEMVINVPAKATVLLPTHMILMIKRIIDIGYVEWIKTKNKANLEGFKLNPEHIILTDKGREFVSELSEEDIGY